jgi:glycosyltransferase involved in cell wall biosynthesis
MSTPRVFIGLPVYNGSRFLTRALDSLCAQTYRDFTLLIADNASTDDTPRIAKQYCRHDARLRYTRHERNIGAPRNWNFVVERAEGEYFKWATANDECAPEMLERCVAALDADPSAVLSQGRTCLVDEDTGAREDYALDLALLDPQPSQRLRRLCIELALNNGQSGLIRLAALRQTHLDRLYPNGDVALMAELALRGRFIVLPHVLLDRRMGNTTFSRLLKREQIGAFYGEQATRTLMGHRLRLHLDILQATLQAPMDTGEKLRAVTFALRHLAWDREHLWSDLRTRFSTHRAGA